MRLKVTQSAQQKVHTDLAGALGWNVWGELFSCADDQTIHKWNTLGEPEGKVRLGLRAVNTPTKMWDAGRREGAASQVCNIDAYYTDLHWYPVSSKKSQAGGTDVFAVSCTDGRFGPPPALTSCL